MNNQLPWAILLCFIEPSPVANAFRTFNITPHGVTVTYRCMDGHINTSVNLTRHCSVNQGATPVFTKPPPVCALDCNTPRAISEATHNVSAYLAGAVVGYECSQGYRLPNHLDSTMRCWPPAGQWDGEHAKILCRTELPLGEASVHQSPQGPRAAELAVDGNISTCSATGNSTKPVWTVFLSNQSIDVITMEITLRLSDPADLSLTLKADVFGGEVETCGKLNMTKVSFLDENTLVGNIHCSSYTTNSKPYGHNLTLSASFNEGQAAGSLQICDLRVKGAPHTASCNWPPRIPRLRLVTEGRTAFNQTDTVYYVCEDPFTPLYGSGNSTCGYDTLWSTPSLVCSDAEDRIKDRIEVPDGSNTKVELTLNGSFKIIGVYINSTTQESVTVGLRQGATSSLEKSCDVKNQSDAGLFVSCPYRPVASLVLVTFTTLHFQHVSIEHIKVFGTPFTTGFECLQTETGSEYKGQQNVTKGGHSCKRWDGVSPGPFTVDDFPDYSLEEAGNFCRNPAHSQDLPWCYVDDAQGWDSCDLFHCDQFCKVKGDGTDYKGNQYTALGGKNCKNWMEWPTYMALPFQRAQDFADQRMDHRFCRNPAGSQSVPWCFVGSNDENLGGIEGVISVSHQLFYYDLCDIPFCPTSVSSLFIKQSNLSLMGAEFNDSYVIQECHVDTDIQHYAATSLGDLVMAACQGWEDYNRTALCRSNPLSGPASNTTVWSRIVILCDGIEMVTSTVILSSSTVEMSPSSSDMMPSTTDLLSSSSVSFFVDLPSSFSPVSAASTADLWSSDAIESESDSVMLQSSYNTPFSGETQLLTSFLLTSPWTVWETDSLSSWYSYLTTEPFSPSGDLSTQTVFTVEPSPLSGWMNDLMTTSLVSLTTELASPGMPASTQATTETTSYSVETTQSSASADTTTDTTASPETIAQTTASPEATAQTTISSETTTQITAPSETITQSTDSLKTTTHTTITPETTTQITAPSETITPSTDSLKTTTHTTTSPETTTQTTALAKATPQTTTSSQAPRTPLQITTQLTPTPTARPPPKMLCPGHCNCRRTQKTYNSYNNQNPAAGGAGQDNSVIEQMTSSIQRELAISHSNLSRTVRRKTSAQDNRTSAVTVGSFGVLLLAVAFLLIMASDVIEAFCRAGEAPAARESK